MKQNNLTDEMVLTLITDAIAAAPVCNTTKRPRQKILGFEASMVVTQQIQSIIDDEEAFSPGETPVFGHRFMNDVSRAVSWIRRVCDQNNIVIELQAFSLAMLRFEVAAHCNHRTYTSRMVHDLLVDFVFYTGVRITNLERFRFCCSLFSDEKGRLLGMRFVETPSRA